MACWLVTCLLMIPLWQSGFFSHPTIQVILYGCLAIYGFRVLVPFAFGSRQQLIKNAGTIGVSNPWVARMAGIVFGARSPGSRRSFHFVVRFSPHRQFNPQ